MQIYERGEAGERIRREGREMIGIKTQGERKEGECKELCKFDKEVRPSNTPSSRDSILL